MKYCSICGMESEDDALFCANCGGKLVAESGAEQQTARPTANAAPFVGTQPRQTPNAQPNVNPYSAQTRQTFVQPNVNPYGTQPNAAPYGQANANPYGQGNNSANYGAQNTYAGNNYQQTPGGTPYYQGFQQPAKPADVPNGGLIAWSIITLLLCRILGIFALINATQINKCATVQDQQKKISTTKTFCLIGTILGAIATIFYVIYYAGTLGY